MGIAHTIKYFLVSNNKFHKSSNDKPLQKWEGQGKVLGNDTGPIISYCVHVQIRNNKSHYYVQL